MSKIVDCKHCGRRISLRQMPHGGFVAFDFQTDVKHDCHVASPASPARWRATSRRPVVPEPWLAFAEALATSAPAAAPVDQASVTSPRKDYSASRLAIHAASLPIAGMAERAKPDSGNWTSRRQRRVAELLADLPSHDFSDWLRQVDERASAGSVRPPLTMPLVETVITELDVFGTLDHLDLALDLHTGDLQVLIDEAGEDGELELIAGVANGTAIANADLTITCSSEPGVYLLGGKQPAMVVNAPDEMVTLRNVTLDADSRYGTILVLDGHLRLEHCVVSGRTGIVLGPGSGNLEMVDSRIVCPMGGCGIVTATDAVITLERVWIGVHRGIGILDLAAVEAPIELDTVTVVGDDAVPLHVVMSQS